ncbi:MAG: cadherin-like domain-containing protein, partial [Anaerolineae bacterium]|nr:cadherin-like domain-containing protein [Anaerolineae bacterium]
MPKALNSHRSMAVIIRMMAIMLVIGCSVSPAYAHTAVFTTPPDKYAPYVYNIPDQTIYEGEAFATIALDAYVSDPDHDDSELTWSVSENAGLTITIVNRVATITYPEGWTGSETLTFTATDPTKLSGSDTAIFTVLAKLPTNHAPVAADDAYTLDEGATLSVFAPGVLENDSDEDGDSLTATLVSGPAHGTLSFAADGSFSYEHDGSETTSDSFTYSVSDGQETSEAATVALTITPVNDWPAAVDDAYSVQEGGTLIIAALGVLANDTDAEGDTLTASL